MITYDIIYEEILKRCKGVDYDWYSKKTEKVYYYGSIYEFLIISDRDNLISLRQEYTKTLNIWRNYLPIDYELHKGTITIMNMHEATYKDVCLLILISSIIFADSSDFGYRPNKQKCNPNKEYSFFNDYLLKICREKGGTLLTKCFSYIGEVKIRCRSTHIFIQEFLNLVNECWCPYCKIILTNPTLSSTYGDSLDQKLINDIYGKSYPFGRLYIENMSKGEEICCDALTSFRISYTSECRVKIDNNYYYDFHFKYNGDCFLEYDGKQHFEMTPFFCKSNEEFIRRREIDVKKTLYALRNNIRIIRIDYTQEKKVKEHLDLFLKSDKEYYFSTPSLYSWIIKEIEKERGIIITNVEPKITVSKSQIITSNGTVINITN